MHSSISREDDWVHKVCMCHVGNLASQNLPADQRYDMHVRACHCAEVKGWLAQLTLQPAEYIWQFESSHEK